MDRLTPPRATTTSEGVPWTSLRLTAGLRCGCKEVLGGRMARGHDARRRATHRRPAVARAPCARRHDGHAYTAAACIPWQARGTHNFRAVLGEGDNRPNLHLVVRHTQEAELGVCRGGVESVTAVGVLADVIEHRLPSECLVCKAVFYVSHATRVTDVAKAINAAALVDPCSGQPIRAVACLGQMGASAKEEALVALGYS